MRKRKTLIAGIACGVLCAACVFAYVQDISDRFEAQRAEALQRYGGDQLEVLVAVRDIQPGETVQAVDVEKRLWLVDLLPDEALRSSENVVGKRVSSLVLSGEVLSEKRFQEIDSALSVPAGKVVLSLPARDVQTVGGAIAPGMTVDVYATGATSTERLVEGVFVVSTSLASRQGSASSEGSLSWVTVAVDAQDVQQLVAAAQRSELYFTVPGEALAQDEEKEGDVDEHLAVR